MDRTGAFLGVGRDLGSAATRAALAEDLGYDSIWMTQIADRDTMLSLTAYAAATERVKLGTGVLPFYARTPANMAQCAATLGELSGGRFILGIGPSHKPAVEAFFGKEYRKPLRDTREYVTIVRQILEQGGSAFSGERYSCQFFWMGYSPPHRVPIYLSTLSPKMCRTAGELADGVILWCCTPDYIRDHIVPNVREGAEAAGRDPDAIEVVAAVPVSLSEDPRAARETMRRNLFVYWTLPNYRAAIERAGFGEAIAAFDAAAADGPEAARAQIPDEFCDALGAVGDAEALRAKVDEYRAKGATVPAIGPFSGHEGAAGADETLRAVAGG